RRSDARTDSAQAGVAARHGDRRRARARGGGSPEAHRRALSLRARGVLADRRAAPRPRPAPDEGRIVPVSYLKRAWRTLTFELPAQGVLQHNDADDPLPYYYHPWVGWLY